VIDRLRSLVARAHRGGALALESGALADFPGAADLSALYARTAARSFSTASSSTRARVFEVTGATLGGSWKTPLTLAISLEISRVGFPVTVVCHGYRAEVRGARIASRTSALRDVGDEALLVATRLHRETPHGGRNDISYDFDNIEVVVAAAHRDRVEVVLSAIARGRIVVVDGRIRDLPASVARHGILALDAESPWGAGACPPTGDLRAPIEALCASASKIVIVRDELFLDPTAPRDHVSKGLLEPRDIETLRAALAVPARLVGQAVCVVTACARPDRFVRSIERRGVIVDRHIALPDHGGAPARALLADELVRVPRNLPLVLTEKCAFSLESAVRGRAVEVIPVELVEDDVSRLMTPFLRGVSLV
jgi:tetraacyldisaccharide-1-P 4'-kinase